MVGLYRYPDLLSVKVPEPRKPLPYDRDALIAKCDGDAALLHQIIGLFLGDFETQLATLQSALRNADIDRLYSITHSIKGSVSHFSAARAVAAAQGIEACCRRGDLPGAAPGVAELSDAMHELAAALRHDPAAA